MHRWRLTFIAIVGSMIIFGLVMIGLHGLSFFLFRSGGTGETPTLTGRSENQGPGQPDAPKPSPTRTPAPSQRASAPRSPSSTSSIPSFVPLPVSTSSLYGG